MMTTRIDLRSDSSRGGTSVLAYEKDGVRVSIGNWTSVDLGYVQFSFDRTDPFLRDLRLDDGSAASKDVADLTIRRATELCTPNMVGLLVDAIPSAHKWGVIKGREDMAFDMRSLLGIK